MTATAGEGGVDIAVGVAGGVGDRVEAVGDLYSNGAVVGVGGVGVEANGEVTVAERFWHTGDDELIGTDDDHAGGFAEEDFGTGITGEVGAADREFATGEGGGRLKAIDTNGGHCAAGSMIAEAASLGGVRDFDFDVAAGRCCVYDRDDAVKMEFDGRPLLISKHYDGKLSSG